MLLHCDEYQGNLNVTAHWTYDSTNLWRVVPILMQHSSDSPLLCLSPASFTYRRLMEYSGSRTFWPDLQIFQSSKLNNKNASITISKGSGIIANSATNIAYGSVYSADHGGLWYAMSPTGGTATDLWDNDLGFAYMQSACSNGSVGTSNFEPSFTYIQRLAPSGESDSKKYVFCYSYAMAVNIKGARIGLWTNLEHILPIEPDMNGSSATFMTNIREILGFADSQHVFMVEEYDDQYSNELIWGKESDAEGASHQSFLFRGSFYANQAYRCFQRNAGMAFYIPWIKFKPSDLTFYGENTECTIDINFCEVTESYILR